MSISTIKKEKRNRLFKKGDLMVYFILAVLIVVLFLIFVVDKEKGDYDGFEVILEETVILKYNFDNNKYIITSGFEDNFLIEENSDGLFITIYTDNANIHFNKLLVDINNKHLHMVDANCSSSKDCTKMSIKDDNDAIVCVPHKLKVKIISNSITQPISG